MTARRLPYGPMDPATLVRFERQLPGVIPSDLRQFLLESNGAAVSRSAQFENVPGGSPISTSRLNWPTNLS